MKNSLTANRPTEFKSTILIDYNRIKIDYLTLYYYLFDYLH